MNRLTKIIAPVLAASLALGAAAPAFAAPWNTGGDLRKQINQLDRKVDQAERRHLISRQEAGRLDRLVDQLENLHARYAKNGFSRTELRTLDQRIDTVDRQIDSEIRDRDGQRGHDRDHRW